MITAQIENRDKGQRVVVLYNDGEPVGNVLFGKPYKGVSAGLLRWMDKDFNRHEDVAFALATPESVVERAEFIVHKYIIGKGGQRCQTRNRSVLGSMNHMMRLYRQGEGAVRSV